jgi:hypothetical protein
MQLEELVHQVEARLANFGRRLVPSDPAEHLEEELARVAHELSQAQDHLTKTEAELQLVHQRQEEYEPASVLLPSQIENSLRRGKTAQAFRQALELDRMRRALEEDRRLLPRLEQTSWSLSFLVRQLHRHRDRLQVQLADLERNGNRRVRSAEDPRG